MTETTSFLPAGRGNKGKDICVKLVIYNGTFLVLIFSTFRKKMFVSRTLCGKYKRQDVNLQNYTRRFLRKLKESHGMAVKNIVPRNNRGKLYDHYFSKLFFAGTFLLRRLSGFFFRAGNTRSLRRR